MSELPYEIALTDQFPTLKKYFTSVEFVYVGLSRSSKANNYRVVFKGNTKIEPSILVTENRNSGMVHLLPAQTALIGTEIHPCQLDEVHLLGLRGNDITIVSMEAYIVAATFVLEFLQKKL